MDAHHVGLFNSYADTATNANVDTADELSNLASIVDRLMDVASAGSSTPALSPTDFATFGISGVTTANLATVLSSIHEAGVSGSDTMAELRSVVSTAVTLASNASLARIAAYNGSNAVPAVADYVNVGVTGVTSNNLSSINTAFAQLSSAQSDSQAEIQAIVNVYLAILTAADGIDNDNSAMTAGDFGTLGLTAIGGHADTTDASAALFDDVLDKMSTSDVDTWTKLSNLVTPLVGIMDTAAGRTPSPALTTASFSALGFTGVTAATLPYVLADIAPFVAPTSSASPSASPSPSPSASATSEDPVVTIADVDTFAELQAKITADALAAYSDAQDVISHYDGTNTVPRALNFTNFEVTGVNDANMAPINSVLAMLDQQSSDETSEVQPIVDAYSLVLAAADGVANANASLSAAQYQALGLTRIDVANKVSLMNDIVDAEPRTHVDTYEELAALSWIAANIIAVGAGASALDANGDPATLTVDDFTAINMTGVDSTNIHLVLAAIDALGGDPSLVNSRAKIQALITGVHDAQVTALGLISAYDGVTTAPVNGTFTDAGVLRVDSRYVDVLNGYLAVITPENSDETAEVQATVDALNKLLICADGDEFNTLCDLTMEDMQALGFTDIDTEIEVIELNKIFDTMDFTIVSDPAQTGEQASIIAELYKPIPELEERAGGSGAVDISTWLPALSLFRPTLEIAPASVPATTVTPQRPRPPLTVVPESTSGASARPVYVNAPVPGADIPALAAGEVAAVAGGQAVDVRIVEQAPSMTIIAVTNGIGIDVSSDLTSARPEDLVEQPGAPNRMHAVVSHRVTVTGNGFRANTLVDIWLFSTPTHLGTVRTDATGAFVADFLVPSTVPVGTHTLKIDGQATDGKVITVTVGIDVLAPAETSSTPVPAPTASGEPIASAPTGGAQLGLGWLVGLLALMLLVGVGGARFLRRRQGL